MSHYVAQFDPGLDVAQAPQARRTIIVASTPRSGSHMLGHSMAQTGRLGVPFEYANRHNLPAWESRLGTRGMKPTLAAIMARRTSPNGIFAIKLHYSHFQDLGGIGAVRALFPDPVFVHIYRADLLAQALSYARALQTGIWIDGMAGNVDAARYDYRLIRSCLEELAVHNAFWRSTFAAEGLDFADLGFHQVIQDTPGVLRSVAALAGVDLSGAALPASPPTRRQSGPAAVPDDLRRYLADRAAAADQRAAWAAATRPMRRLLSRLPGR